MFWIFNQEKCMATPNTVPRIQITPLQPIKSTEKKPTPQRKPISNECTNSKPVLYIRILWELCVWIKKATGIWEEEKYENDIDGFQKFSSFCLYCRKLCMPSFRTIVMMYWIPSRGKKMNATRVKEREKNILLISRNPAQYNLFSGSLFPCLRFVIYVVSLSHIWCCKKRRRNEKRP